VLVSMCFIFSGYCYCGWYGKTNAGSVWRSSK